MKRIYKKLLVLGLAVSCCISFAGCGKKDSQSTGGETESSKNDFVYVAEYQPVAAENMSTLTIGGDTIYYLSGQYNEETEEYKQEICSLKIGETEPATLPVTLEPNSYINNMYVDEEGNLVTILSKTEGEGENMRNLSFLNKYSMDGALLSSTDLTSLGEGQEYFYIQYIVSDKQGNIYVSNGETAIWIIDKDGNEMGSIACDSWISAMFTLPNGTVAVTSWGNEGSMVLSEIDAAAKSFGKTYKNLPQSAHSDFVSSGENKILMSGNNIVYEYDLTTETYEEVLNWINCDVDANNIQRISKLEDGRILAVSREYAEEKTKTELIYLTKKAASEVTDKTTITLGTMYLEDSVKKNIINFNKTNEKYRIEVKEYGNDSQDWTEAVNQMNTAIISGNGPDLIDLTNGNANAYIAKGVLEDLTPYIEAAEDINPADYVESAFYAYQNGDKLYGLVPSFTLQTVMGKTADVGSEPGWTIDDVMALLESKPEGTELFSYCTKETVLYYCVNMSQDQFIDWETGECKFSDGYFEKVLELANKFPKEANYNEDDESIPSKIQSGKLLLQQMAVADVQEYQMYKAMFGEDITFIGFPTNGGTGTYVRPTSALGISSKAQNKEGAWEFLKSFLSEEYQKNYISWYMPVLKSALDAQFEEDMTPEYFEEDGEKVEQPKTTWGYDDFEVKIYAAKQEEIDAIKELIDSADGIGNTNEEITAIIAEETAAYFEGQKNAKEVADIIQNRVQIYVNENR